MHLYCLLSLESLSECEPPTLPNVLPEAGIKFLVQSADYMLPKPTPIMLTAPNFHKIQGQGRAQREFTIPGILVRIMLIFSRLTLRHQFAYLALISNSEMLRKNIPFSSRSLRFRIKIPVLVSNLEIERDQIPISSQKIKESISLMGVVCQAVVNPIASRRAG